MVICHPAVVAAVVTRKDLCEFHIRTDRTEIAVYTDNQSEKERRGGVTPATLQVLAYLQRTLVFTLACPRAGFWGG
ncbi:Hok/Gef family protein [Escherichia coli]|nr:Hok/Gef family protein [Escherichia coli]